MNEGKNEEDGVRFFVFFSIIPRYLYYGNDLSTASICIKMHHYATIFCMRITISLTEEEYNLMQSDALSNGRSLSSEARFRIVNFRKPLKVEMYEKKEQILEKVCPFKGWQIMFNTKGKQEPDYDENSNKVGIWIQMVKPPFQKAFLSKDDEWYDYFIKQ